MQFLRAHQESDTHWRETAVAGRLEAYLCAPSLPVAWLPYRFTLNVLALLAPQRPRPPAECPRHAPWATTLRSTRKRPHERSRRARVAPVASVAEQPLRHRRIQTQLTEPTIRGDQLPNCRFCRFRRAGVAMLHDCRSDGHARRLDSRNRCAPRLAKTREAFSQTYKGGFGRRGVSSPTDAYRHGSLDIQGRRRAPKVGVRCPGA